MAQKCVGTKLQSGSEN